MESLQRRRWHRKLSCFYNILKGQSPKYLFDIFPKLTTPCCSRNADNIPHFKVKHSFFKNILLPSVIIEWNKPTLNIYKKNILKFIRPTANNIFGCCNVKGMKYLTRLRLGISHLYELSSKITSKIH